MFAWLTVLFLGHLTSGASRLLNSYFIYQFFNKKNCCIVVRDEGDCESYPCLIFDDQFDFFDHDAWSHVITLNGGSVNINNIFVDSFSELKVAFRMVNSKSMSTIEAFRIQKMAFSLSSRYKDDQSST